MRYQDVIDNLRQFYMERIVTQQRIPEATITDARYPDHIVEHAQGFMAEELAKKLDKVVRKSVVEDPRHHTTIYENDIFVMLDPSGFFQQLDKELENAYQHGFQAGRQLTERRMRSSTYGAKD